MKTNQNSIPKLQNLSDDLIKRISKPFSTETIRWANLPC